MRHSRIKNDRLFFMLFVEFKKFSINWLKQK
jgi:hypothetical protein